MQTSFYGSIIDMLDRFASQELKDKYIPGIIAGDVSGSMCLTEPDCGSDGGALKSKCNSTRQWHIFNQRNENFYHQRWRGLWFSACSN